MGILSDLARDMDKAKSIEDVVKVLHRLERSVVALEAENKELRARIEELEARL